MSTHSKGPFSFQRMLPTLVACSASCAHLHYLLPVHAGYQLGPVIVYEFKARRGRACPVGMGLDLACGSCGRQWIRARFPPFLCVPFLELFPLTFLWPRLLGGGLGNFCVEPGSWRGL